MAFCWELLPDDERQTIVATAKLITGLAVGRVHVVAQVKPDRSRFPVLSIMPEGVGSKNFEPVAPELRFLNGEQIGPA